MKKGLITSMSAIVLALSLGSAAGAQNVVNPNNHHNGDWEHYRSGVLWLYGTTDVTSTYYKHSATSESTPSGVKNPGQKATATAYVQGTFDSYWYVY
jgi:hypothetical protein